MPSGLHRSRFYCHFRALKWTAALAALWLVAAAGCGLKRGKPVRQSLMLILAAEGPDEHLDPRLKPLATQLRLKFPHLKRFILADGVTQDLAPGEAVDVSIDEENIQARVLYESSSMGRYVLSVQTWRDGDEIGKARFHCRDSELGLYANNLNDEENRLLITAVVPQALD